MYLQDSRYEETNSDSFIAVVYLVTSFIITYGAVTFWNTYIWHIPFNAVDYLVKPFLLLPLAVGILAIIFNWTSLLYRELESFLYISVGSWIFYHFNQQIPFTVIDEAQHRIGKVNYHFLEDMCLENGERISLKNRKIVSHQQPFYVCEKTGRSVSPSFMMQRRIYNFIAQKKEVVLIRGPT
ncbi:hypothetical protein [Evansella tamaricis]|uniref:Photosystem I assembly protein Ycf4 n=1 Tax=Evansella tamaricis TaxID=2069301 RepID=A0ABS6JAL9_9BACI|nr:hypothetical protein [Evansella tamaricis]MBU9710719.1 hypothetical protein [Evansella tamaricis]